MTVKGLDKLLHFDIVEVLGAGGNGTVYRALNTQTNQMVALKTLKNVSEITLTRFKREFLALKKMDNPGIVKVYEDFFEHDPPFFSMEWVRGKTLSEVIQDMEDNPMVFSVADRENFAVRLAVQVCDILTYIHGFEEVHRDLKPDNIFMTLEGGNILSEFHVKMLDFGLLKDINEKDEDGDTEGGMIVGTVHYLSPEQAKGVSLDLRSDLYSLGIIIYKTISLKLPYEAKDVVGYIFKTVFEDPAPIEQQTTEVSKAMQAILQDLLAKEPAKRPPSAANLKRKLQALLKKDEVKKVADIEAGDLDFSTGIEGFGSPLLPPPLIGREDAVKEMEKQAELVNTSAPRGLILMGEEGMGRSSIIKEWRSRIQFQNPTFLQAHFNEDLVPGQEPVGMLLDSLVRTMKPEEVKSVFRETYPFLSGVSRYLGRYFDTKSVGKFDHLSPSRKLQVLAVNFIKLLDTLSDRGPVFIVLEDANFAPEKFFGWLTLFWEQLNNQKVQLIFSTGVDIIGKSANQFYERLKSHPETEEIRLEALSLEQVLKLLQSMLPIGTELTFSDQLQKLIIERAAGNPFYTIELFSRLYEDEHVFINRGVLDVKSIEDIDIPHSIHQALLRKVSKLPPDTLYLLKIASVLGGAFDLKWLSNCLGWQEEQFLERLMLVLKLGILSEEEKPVHKLYFAAPALQQILYEQIPQKDRHHYHNRVAKAIEMTLKDDAVDVIALEQVAYHYTNGDNNVRAIKYAYLAGSSALNAKDVDKAVYFFEMSLGMMDKMENKQARNLVNLKLAEVHLTNQQPDKALAYYNESLGHPNLSKMEELRGLRGRMLCHEAMDHLDSAHEDAKALARLGKTCSGRIKAETLLTRGRLAFQAEGDVIRLRKDLVHAVKVYPKLRDGEVNVLLARILSNDGLNAMKVLTEMVKQKDESRFPVFLQLALLRYFMGDFKKSSAYLAQAKDEKHPDPKMMVFHALLTYKVQSTVAPDHSSDEYLGIARRYIDRFGLDRLRPKVVLIQLEHLLMSGQYEAAWKFTRSLVERSEDLPLEHHDLYLFLSFTMRAAWEMEERPPRGWLIRFQKFQPEENHSFLLKTHWALARASEALLAFSTEAPNAFTFAKETGDQLIQMKFKYYYRALLIKQIALLEKMGHAEKALNFQALLEQLNQSMGLVTEP